MGKASARRVFTLNSQVYTVKHATTPAIGYGEQQELDKIYMTGSVTKTFTVTAFVKLVCVFPNSYISI